MKWSGDCWFLPAASEIFFHEVKTEGMLLRSVCCWVLALQQEKEFAGAVQMRFFPIFPYVKASIVSLDIARWHQHISETQLGNASCSREVAASVFSENFVRMAQLCEMTPEMTHDFSRKCTPCKLTWFVLQFGFPPPNLTLWKVAV